MNIEAWNTLFPHFKPEEYFSPGGLELFRRGTLPCDVTLLTALEELRYVLNVDKHVYGVEKDQEIVLIINTKSHSLRGFVTPAEWINLRSKEQGQTFSFHLWCAADVSSPQVPPAVLFKYARLLSFGGVIEYTWGVHLDMRRGAKYASSRK